MPTHLYCLIPAADCSRDSALPTGVDGATVRTLGGPFVAWVSTTSRAALPSDRAAIEQIVRVHDRVIAAALATARTVIPAPVTSPYANDAACTAEIAERAPTIRALAAQAEGRVEMALLLTSSSAPTEPKALPPGAGPGRRYLEGARDRGPLEADERATQDSANAVRTAVGGFVLGESRRDPGSGVPRAIAPAHWVAISHLIDREAVAAYRAAAAATTLLATVRLVIDGPRAPYSFATFCPTGTILAD